MIQTYLQKIFNLYQSKQAREESYYPTLGLLIESLGEKINDLSVLQLPKKTEGGNPDFRIARGKHKIIGYIEAKDPSVTDLDTIENSEQLKRYRETFPNLILTNFLEFRLYKNGELFKTVTIAKKFIADELDIQPSLENETMFVELFNIFFSYSTPRITTSKQLALELAKRTRFLKSQLIEEHVKEGIIEGTQELEGFYSTFKNYLLSSLSPEEFANLFAQTITYGLFIARSRTDSNFNRELAQKFIPQSIGILRDVFAFISSTRLPISMKIIDDIADILSATDVQKIIHRYYKEGKGTDPIIHFYETFLAEYDPKTRERRGVYYTPESVVSYIVKSINIILKEKFNKSDGFADNSVTVLDPAAGTLTFPVEAIKTAITEHKEKYGEGGVKSFIKDHILKNFYAFELMMASYSIGHLKMSLLLEDFGYKLADYERFKLYLTNTLEIEELGHMDLPLFSSLSEESHLASKVKRDDPIMVILGNPPYSVSSSNRSKFIEKEMELYKEDVRNERNIQPLSDDYIKFIRFAHWKIQRTGKGIIGFVTNNSYLSGLIHRGMRKKLIESFNEIYILDLHGSTRVIESSDNGKDENVFDIMQGVSIAFFIKYEEPKLPAKLLHFNLYGKREIKYEYLEKNTISTTNWERIYPKSSNFFFVKKNLSNQGEYEKFISLNDVFKKGNAGIATGKDQILVSFDKEALASNLALYDRTAFESAMNAQNVDANLITRWFEELNKKDVKSQIVKYNYRPFDSRFTIYNSRILQRARKDIMDNFLNENLGLSVTKQLSSENFSHALVTDSIIDRCYISLQTREVTYVFPLYQYDLVDQKLISQKNKLSNINWAILPSHLQTFQPFTSQVTDSFIQAPEAVFFYIYAILYSNSYRKKYKEFLKIDFPRIPFTKDWNLFKALATLGERLVNLHLLKSTEMNKPISQFQGNGINKIVKPEYNGEEERLYINPAQYFDKVAKNVWEYRMGGYQVLEKYLKYRRDRLISSEEIKHLCRVCTALSKTIVVQEQIDELFPQVEITVL